MKIMGQSDFIDDEQLTEENALAEKILLHTLVGEYLATGMTNEEILTALQEKEELSAEDAQMILRGVYDSWSSVREALNIQAEDERNWHQHLRMKLLQAALKDETTPSQRLALQILDSLAAVQGIATVAAVAVPLSIELVEKKPEPESKPKDTGG